MGIGDSKTSALVIPENESRLFFVKYDSYYSYTGRLFTSNKVFKFYIRYKRFCWYITKRFSEFNRFDARMRFEYAGLMSKIPAPIKKTEFFSHSDEFLRNRGIMLAFYLQRVLDELKDEAPKCLPVRLFLEIGNVSLNRLSDAGFVDHIFPIDFLSR
jgi:hypothetical protein